MQIKEVGVVFDIDANNFLADGSLYANVIDDEYGDKSVAKMISAFSFENTVSKIISDSAVDASIKTEKYYSEEIQDFFNKNIGKKMDIIFFAETGIKGIDKVSIKDSSIIYFSLYGNIKFGFFINKTIANILFGDDE